MTNPTERPDELESLTKPLPSSAEIASWSSYLHRAIGVDDENANHVLSDLTNVARTLINEVKELREENERVVKAARRQAILETEARDALRSRIKQMEEALREAWACIDLKPDRFPQGTIERVRAVLNPSEDAK